ncbi:uncharacterized protein BT62DRAFT_480034 [Guyanagaster necrorhizus]|uniref:Uncharacterized protein n=1 Tax=Guyanagaster necrorhizus TaxID=856835 RepID=A0A9P8AN38_9AGAR|nr:uncharacterized protein BT62DRAFT_480034 [Guyanagaster necrorhizus MCA 3950]KAG7441485.1 hypothetical protein BT62DRAFT_480034 [Guyanagaster necrorhizus MCA 3950]
MMDSTIKPLVLRLESWRYLAGVDVCGRVSLQVLITRFKYSIIVCTILASTPLVVANFVVLGTLIKRLGPVYSRLTPRMYVGGGIASAATTLPATNKGGDIMLGGIVFQLGRRSFYEAYLLSRHHEWKNVAHVRGFDPQHHLSLYSGCVSYYRAK